MPPFTFTTIAFQTKMRAGVMTLLREYITGTGIKGQIYPGRPTKLFAPSFFPDLMNEETVFSGPKNRQRTVRASVLAVWGLFDSLEAVTQRDAFCDGFADYVTDNRDVIDPAAVIGAISFDDIPDFVPNWIAPDEQITYFATRITLEGYVSA